ncbi:hypothetical protein LOAG_04153 [Loa loa]|uniref:Uncharacterized protein n=1 Tax=Loa loa TaxID=7209 RepID=A0A1S0U3J3_LOALO|nr:hypothetical protein LOAG_04153 [Loa loa]EFO24338.1 hypothetical protein LOAG_04153 [Loa loa]
MGFHIIVPFWKNSLGKNEPNQHAVIAYAGQEWTIRARVTKPGSVFLSKKALELSSTTAEKHIRNAHFIVEKLLYYNIERLKHSVASYTGGGLCLWYDLQCQKGLKYQLKGQTKFIHGQDGLASLRATILGGQLQLQTGADGACLAL